MTATNPAKSGKGPEVFNENSSGKFSADLKKAQKSNLDKTKTNGGSFVNSIMQAGEHIISPLSHINKLIFGSAINPDVFVYGFTPTKATNDRPGLAPIAKTGKFNLTDFKCLSDVSKCANNTVFFTRPRTQLFGENI